MIYDVDFKSKQLVGIDKNDYEKKEYTPIDELDKDPVIEFMENQLSYDDFEVYKSTVSHYLNCLFLLDQDKWELFKAMATKKHI